MFPRTTSTAFSLNSVEQVQVLKGPQGALYGRNATGGAIVITTKTPMPGDGFEGQVSASFGNYSLKEFGLSLSGGLSGSVAASLDIASTDRDGFVKSLTPGAPDMDSRDTFLVAGKLVFAPSDTATIELGLWYDESDDTNAHGYQQTNVAPNPQLGGLNGPQALVSGFITPQFAQGVARATLGQMGITNPTPAQLAAAIAAATPAAQIAVGGAAARITFPTGIGRVSNNNNSSFTTGLTPTSPPLFNGKTKNNGAFTYIEDFRATLKATLEFNRFDLVSITALSDHYYNGSTDVLVATQGSVTTPFAAIMVPLLADNLGFSAFLKPILRRRNCVWYRVIPLSSGWPVSIIFRKEAATKSARMYSANLSCKQIMNGMSVR